MHTFTLLTAAVSCAAITSAFPFWPRSDDYTGPKGDGSFNLEVIATNGKPKYSGQWLSTYHTGAGANVLVTTNDQSGSTKFSYNTSDGSIYAVLGAYPYFLSLTGEDIFAPPSGYSFVGFNIGESGPAGSPSTSFTFNTPENILQFPKAIKGEHFAVCPAVIYSEGDYLPTLVFRESGDKKNGTCAEVKVKAVF